MFFADENALGFGKLLRASGRHDIVFPGTPELPQVPLGSPDLQWMPVIARLELIVITRERRLRTRPIELAAYRDHGIRSVRLGAKRDQRPEEQVAMFLQHETRIVEDVARLGAGPWALVLSPSGVREISLREGSR